MIMECVCLIFERELHVGVHYLNETNSSKVENIREK